MQVRAVVDLSNAMKAILKRMGTFQETSAGEPFTTFPSVVDVQIRLDAIRNSPDETDGFSKELANLGSAFEGLIDEEVDL